MRKALLVTVGNDYLGARARNAGARRVEVLPSVVDLDRYEFPSSPDHETFTIGWMGSPTTAPYLRLISPALRELCTKREVRVVLVGSGRVNLEGVPVEIRSWTEDGEVADIQSFHVGVMPMPDEPWTKGKCGYKLVQYMACGLPVVASPVGANRDIVEHGVTGFLAKDMQEWIAFLEVLQNSPTLRRQMGQAGRKKVQWRYCIEVTAPRLESLLKSAASG
jgi:glycosyltransferase involved in cell wall biosynthesis